MGCSCNLPILHKVNILEDNRTARPGYDSQKAHEYEDTPDSRVRKLVLLTALLKSSKQGTIYSGAGISTASGIGDYASANDDSKANLAMGGMKIRSFYDAQPTLSHRVCAALYNAGLIKHWVFETFIHSVGAAEPRRPSTKSWLPTARSERDSRCLVCPRQPR